MSAPWGSKIQLEERAKRRRNSARGGVKVSNSERHQERRRQRAKQKEKENNMRTYRGKDNAESTINLVSTPVQKKSWLSRLGARIKALWPGGKATQKKEPRP